MKSVLAALALLTLPARAETFYYTAEWRGLDAGKVELNWEATGAALKLSTIGLAARLYVVDDEYTVTYDVNRCVSKTFMDEKEGKKKKKILVTYHDGKAQYSDGETKAEVAVPACTHDIVAGILQLRYMPINKGSKVTIPVSDGKKFAQVQVEGLEHEIVKTPAGTFPATRIEAHLFNGVIYRRKAKAMLWFTEEKRRIPVQMQVQLPFWIGSVTLKLDKEK